MKDWKELMADALKLIPESVRGPILEELIADTEAGRPFAQPAPAKPVTDTDEEDTAEIEAEKPKPRLRLPFNWHATPKPVKK